MLLYYELQRAGDRARFTALRRWCGTTGDDEDADADADAAARWFLAAAVPYAYVLWMLPSRSIGRTTDGPGTDCGNKWPRSAIYYLVCPSGVQVLVRAVPGPVRVCVHRATPCSGSSAGSAADADPDRRQQPAASRVKWGRYTSVLMPGWAWFNSFRPHNQCPSLARPLVTRTTVLLTTTS